MRPFAASTVLCDHCGSRRQAIDRQCALCFVGYFGVLTRPRPEAQGSWLGVSVGNRSNVAWLAFRRADCRDRPVVASRPKAARSIVTLPTVAEIVARKLVAAKQTFTDRQAGPIAS